MFDSPERLLLGLLIGVLFGVLLQKGRVAKFPVIVGQFILKDWTVVKIMGTAVVVGSVGVYALVASGHANLHVKPFLLGGVLLGGVCFGVGMAVFGYCPVRCTAWTAPRRRPCTRAESRCRTITSARRSGRPPRVRGGVRTRP